MPLLCLAASWLVLQASTPPAHLRLARELVSAVKPADTAYRHNETLVVWPAEGVRAECRTDCSGFWNVLIPKAYPDITPERLQGWIGKKRPRAEDYFAVMRKGTGFTLRKKIDDVHPGDFIAIKYEPKADNTGHTMIVDGDPKPLSPSAPLQEGTRQFEVLVIDVTSSPHGATDSRGTAPGLGRGSIRIYANADGTLAGHAWGLSPKSKFRPVSLRPVLIGGLDPAGIRANEKTPDRSGAMIARFSAAKGRAKPLQILQLF